MPAPDSTPLADIPDFDPDVHCGGLTREQLTCMRVAGSGTNHPGVGRCDLHGGRHGGEPIPKSVTNNLPMKFTGLLARAKEIRDSEDLLVVDNEIAVTKAYFEAQVKGFEDAERYYYKTLKDIESGVYDGAEGDDSVIPPPPALPELDLKTLDTMVRLVKLAYDMRFARRFSIPISELENVASQIRTAFIEVCEKYVQDVELKRTLQAAFGDKIQNIQLSRKQADWQLDRAGGERSNMIDVQAVGSR